MALFIAISTIVSAQKSAKIKFDTKDHDFGKIHEELGKVVVKFNFTNAGNDTLKISSADPSCSCTTADWTRTPVPPGGTGYVTADYDPRQRPGEFDKWVDVKSNATEPVVKLSIKGFVIPRTKTFADSFPVKQGNFYLGRKMIALKNTANTETKSDSMEVYNASSKPMKLSFANLPAHITARTKKEIVAPSSRGMVYFKYNAAKRNEYGIVYDTVKLTTDDNDTPIKSIVLSATITDDFSKLTEAQKKDAPKVSFTEKETQDYGSVKSGDKVVKYFEVKNDGKNPLIIRKATPGKPEDCKIIMPEKTTLAAGETSKIGIEFNTAGSGGNDVRRTILVTTNDPGRPFLILIIKGAITF